MEIESQKMSAYAARKFGRGAALALAMASAGLGVSLYMAPAPAYAIYCSNCSTFYQQMYEYAEAVNTQLNTAQQLATQIQQYQNMVTQGLSLPNSMFGSIAAEIAGLGPPNPEHGFAVQHAVSGLRVLPESSRELGGGSGAGSLSEVVRAGSRQRESGDGSGEPQHRHFRI